jgi:carboxypeptidase Taq
MRAEEAYNELVRRTREQRLLSSCSELLGWDELTCMPPAGVAHRASQMALLAGLSHQKATDPRLGDLLAAVEGSALVADPESVASVNVRELRRAYDRLVRLPRSLVEEEARLTSVAQQQWSAARDADDFQPFRPWLEKVIVLKREQAECLGYEDTPYDALLEDYEPGLRYRDLVPLFEALRRELVPLASLASLASAVAAGFQPADAPAKLHRRFPVERQRLFGAEVAAALGFDFHGGRLDTSVHPFSTLVGPGDCRITTRYNDRNFSESFFSILHETGHALYDQGLPAEHHGTPMGEPVSLGVHESQARLWENTVGRSRSFWLHFFPSAQRAFPGVLDDVDAEDFYRAVSQVAAGPNRIRADEVTYNLHILIRFELEVALVQGDLSTADVPAAWGESYRRHLGVTPASDAEGCLQDGHWGAGLVGYFPTYTLGNIFAGQLFDRAEEELGDLSGQFARGEFGGLLGWLREKVHRQGQRYRAPRLMERVTGAALDHRPLVRRLREKYRELKLG